MYDFSSGFNTINGAIANIGKQRDQEIKRQALAALGQDLAAGNYASAAQKALASGDPSVGIAILGLGQKADERKAEAAWYAGNGGGGGMGQPMAALGQGVSGNGGASAPRPFNRPVQVAETEADTQRLEADMERRSGLGYGNPMLPAGMRNNNPGNIKFVGTGQAPGVVGPSVNTDQGDPQAVFNSPEAGMSAAYGLALRKYQGGKRTALDLVAGQGGWTPGNQAAAVNIARTMGVAPNEDLRLDDPQRAQAFMQALISQEHGKSGGLYPQEMIAGAVGGGAQPVQVAQAPGPVADMPAAGAQPAQGFSVPGGQAEQAPGLSADPQVQLWSQRLATAPTERARAVAKQRLDLAVADAKTRVDEGGPLTQEGRRLANEKARRELQGEQPIPLTPEERQKFGIRPDQAAYKTRDGIKFGPAGTTIVNEAQKLQGAEDKARVDVNTKFLGKLADSGPQVSQRMADMDVLAAVIRDAPPGPTADAQVFFDRIGAGLGFSKGELATRSDAMKAIVQRLAPAQREEGSGSTSDIEFKGMLASFPSLAATGEGRQMILTTIARQNEITRMRVEVADQWTQGEIPATEARKRIAQIDRASIYASEDEKKLIRKLAGTARGGDLGKASPAMTREVGGKLYEQRGGQWYAKEAN